MSTERDIDSAAESRDDRIARVWDVLSEIPDPEIPVLTIVDLGIVRGVETVGGGQIEVVITPTYMGCPATQLIQEQIRAQLDASGFESAGIVVRLDPPWTTDWMSEEGRQKLKRFGISPPPQRSEKRPVECPRCGSGETEMISEFGSTPCKAHYRCNACLEPFDHFKCI